jgi:hypothetical protein
MEIIFKGKNKEEYEKIWREEGENMIKKIEKYSNMNFATQELEAVVYDGKSSSHPLMLRDSYPYDLKRAVLIHELLHILFVDNEIKFKDSLSLHNYLYSFYKDILLDLYGKEFLNYVIGEESKLGKVYKEAWKEILERKE